MQLSNKQKDLLNTFAEKERHTSETHRAMVNVESVPKKYQKLQLFFDQDSPGIYRWQKLSQHAAQLNGFPSIIAKI